MTGCTAAAPVPLLLLPGLMCDGAVWQPQIDALDAAVRPCVADYGHADSLATMARRALQQADAAGLTGPLAVAGHSMGGRVALELWRLAPQRVARLALLDTGVHPLPAGEAGAQEREGRMALVRQALTEGMRPMARVWARGMVHPDHLAAPLFTAVLQMLDRCPPSRFAAQQQALLNRPDASGQLASIAVPTLVLCGAQDHWSPPAQHEAMARALPAKAQPRLVVVPDAGHMVTLEAPAAVTAALRDWLIA